MIKKADMHVHSVYSEHPSEWFLQRLGAGESYSLPADIYRIARQKGMDYVTITDHNRIDGVMLLRDKHPDDVFTGVETTAYFPVDGCKVHILIYGFEEDEFAEIQRLRRNICELREYLRARNLTHSLAHPFTSVNGRLSMEHSKQLLAMFNIFEARNGGRSQLVNDVALDLVRGVPQSELEKISRDFGIKKRGADLRRKGFTAGSNDHSGLFVGETYTMADAVSKGDFLKNIRAGRGMIEGRNADFLTHSFSVFKVAYDFSKHEGMKISSRVIEDLTENIFKARELGFFDKIRLKSINATLHLGGNDITSRKIMQLIAQLSHSPVAGHEERFDMVYKTITSISDDIIREVIKSITDDLENLNIFSFLGRMSTYFAPMFMIAPFLTSINYLYRDRRLIDQLRAEYHLACEDSEKRILWFTDTINDLNGVSYTLQQLGHKAAERNAEIMLATSLGEGESRKGLPENVMYLDSIYSFTAPYYDRYRLKVPSLLGSIKKIYEYNPDEIYISTPGFAGLTGLLCAKLMKIPSVGVFHTDFLLQLKAISDEDSLYSMVDTFTRWFYTSVDFIAVPTPEYVRVLTEYGFKRENITRLSKAVETDVFRPIENAREIVSEKYGIGEGINLLFTGRVSLDKRLDAMMEIFERCVRLRTDINLIIAGDGPYLDELRSKYGEWGNIYLLGRIPREELPELYSAADVFLFPSEADTFGMSVLEAQACGVPAIVSDKGGPRDIVIDGETGYVAAVGNREEWVGRIIELCEKTDSGEIDDIKRASIENARGRFSWENVFEDIFDELKPIQ